MKTIKSTSLLMAFLFMGGCSQMSTTTQQDASADFSQFSTYDWGEGDIQVDRTGKTVDRIIDQIAVMVRDNIEPLVDEQLKQKGYTRTKEGKPDFIVQYSARGKVEKDVPEGGRTSRHGIEGQTGELMRSGYLVIGDLTVSIVRPNQHELLWKGEVETILKGDGSTTTRLKKAISKMFRDFPAK